MPNDEKAIEFYSNENMNWNKKRNDGGTNIDLLNLN